MVVLLILVLLAVIAGAALAWTALAARIRERERVAADLGGPVPTLEYEVPTGQDPAVLVAALHQAGYEAVVDPSHSHQLVLIACPAGVGRERAHVRAVLAGARVTAVEHGIPIDPEIRFTDE